MTAHITLNGKKYMLQEPVTSSYQKANYNPMAAQVAQGGEYDDLQDWSAWLMDDWQAGFGQRDPNAGGFLYGNADTRFKNQITLTPMWHPRGQGAPENLGWYPNPFSYASYDIDGELTVGSGGTASVSNYVAATNGGKIYHIWFMAEASPSVEITVTVYAATAGGALDSGTSLGSTTVTPEVSLGPRWYKATFSPALTVEAPYVSRVWVQFAPTDSGESFTMPTMNSTLVVFFSNLDPLCTLASLSSSGFEVQKGGMYDNEMYIACGTKVSYETGANYLQRIEYSGGSDEFPGTVTDLCEFNNLFWVASNGTAYKKAAPKSAGNFSSTVAGTLFLQWNGYLFSAYQNDVRYTADGTTWSGPFEVGPNDFEIRGMAGMGDTIYLSTDDGLYALMPGDFVVGVVPWPAVENTNGRNMINWNGSLYIPVGAGLVRYTADGQLIPMGLDQGEGLEQGKTGKIRDLTATSNWLIAAVDSVASGGISSVWAWNGQGWHCLAEMPPDLGISSMVYDRYNSRLTLGTRHSIAISVDLPDSADNPLKADTETHTFRSEIEFPQFYGGLKEITKDYESIYIFGQNISSTRFVEVYWKDDDSTAWEYLGVVTSNRQELRWSSSNTRPASKQIRIKMVLQTDDRLETPVIEAIRVKFHPMLTDLFRWLLSIRVADNIQWLDLTVDPRSSATIEGDIDTVLTSIPPVTFVDIDGTSYTVKAEQGSMAVVRMEYNGGALDYEAVYRIGLRQVV